MIVSKHFDSAFAARCALLEAGPVCVHAEHASVDAAPKTPGLFLFRAEFVGVENDQRVFKLRELLR